MASHARIAGSEPASGRARQASLLRPARAAPVLWRKAAGSACCEHERLDAAPAPSELVVGDPDDPIEHEAERVADSVLAETAPDVPVEVSRDRDRATRRMCAECSEENEKKKKREDDAGDTVRREPSGGGAPAGGSVPAVVAQAVHGDAGRPLPAGERAFFEARLGHDLRDVRVHAGARAAEAADAVQARAFTLGDDIYFASGEFRPGARDGRRLLAHELAHVLQQRGGTTLRRTLRLTPKVKWRKDKELTYATRKQAQDQVDFLRSLGFSADAPSQGKNQQWGFEYEPLDEKEAEAQRDAKQKANKTSTYTVEWSDRARSYYVKEVKKCPDAIPARPGYSIWDKCFADAKSARALVREFAALHVEAELYELSSTQFGVYYKPLTQEQAEASGKDEIAKKPDADEGMYTVKASEDKAHHTFTWKIEIGCPAGYDKLGDSYHITSYAFALEELHKSSPLIEVECGDLKGKKFHRDFLLKNASDGACPFGVKMEGSGIALDGTIVHYERQGKQDCFSKASCALGNRGKCLTDDGVATGPEIASGTELLIERFGKRSAQDVGGGIKRGEIDVWAKKDWKTACATNFHGTVCKKK